MEKASASSSNNRYNSRKVSRKPTARLRAGGKVEVEKANANSSNNNRYNSRKVSRRPTARLRAGDKVEVEKARVSNNSSSKARCNSNS